MSNNVFLASLPAKRMSAGCVIRDVHGNVLVVQPTYKKTLEIPGGITEQNESPKHCARREITEELGLNLEPGRLLVVNYGSPSMERTESLSFIFDGGILEPELIAQIRLPNIELESFRFVLVKELPRLLIVDLARRVICALDALEAGETWYLEDGVKTHL